MDSLHKLTQLRTDTNRTRWTEATAHRAPHKPFLLLSILDLAAQGQIDSPFIEPSLEVSPVLLSQSGGQAGVCRR